MVDLLQCCGCRMGCESQIVVDVEKGLKRGRNKRLFVLIEDEGEDDDTKE